jgi:hypothetical protein
MTPVERLSHPRLAAVALAGAGWWILGLVVGVAGPASLGGTAAVVHGLGLVTLLATGVLYVALWWADYAESKLRG